MKLPDKILITNDDGIDAPGILALQKVVEELGGKPVVVAPRDAQSGCSHYVSMYDPIAVEERSDTQIAVDGSPADCVRLALHSYLPDAALVLSGINAGGNMGHDVYLSGTVAAAREAAFHGIPAIALSQYVSPARYMVKARIIAHARQAIEALLQEPRDAGAFWNVNLPDLPEHAPEPKLVRCERCLQGLPAKYNVSEAGFHYLRDKYHERPRDADSDVEVCMGGDVAITKMAL